MDQAQQLRNVIREQNEKKQKKTARIFTVTSGKGGVGKTNIAINLAVQMQRKGKKVLVFDADFGLANVEVVVGAIPKYSLSDVIYGKKKLREIITPGPDGIGFISGGSGVLGLNNLTEEQLDRIVGDMAELNELADILIIDTGAGISDSVLKFVLASPEVLLVTTPEPSSLTDAYSLLKVLYHSEAFDRRRCRINVIANRVGSDSEGRTVYEKLDSVVKQFLAGNINYIGMVPQDSALEKAVRQQKPVAVCSPSSRSARAFDELARLLLNGECEEENVRWGFTSLIQMLVKH